MWSLVIKDGTEDQGYEQVSVTHEDVLYSRGFGVGTAESLVARTSEGEQIGALLVGRSSVNLNDDGVISITGQGGEVREHQFGSQFEFSMYFVLGASGVTWELATADCGNAAA